jgi:hypothetical protein
VGTPCPGVSVKPDLTSFLRKIGLKRPTPARLIGGPSVRMARKRNSRLQSARRLGLAATGLALVAGVLPVIDGVVMGTTVIARADDVTASQNLLRDAWDPNEPDLSPASVESFSSAPRWTATIDGSVYAQPLVLGSIVIVATESDWARRSGPRGSAAHTRSPAIPRSRKRSRPAPTWCPTSA